MKLLDVDHLGPEELRLLVRQKSGKGLSKVRGSHMGVDKGWVQHKT